MKKLIVITVIIFIAVSSVYSQNIAPRLNDKPATDFISRFAIEAGISKSYPIQNLAEYNTSSIYTFTGSLYARVTDKFSAYFNYNSIDIGGMTGLVVHNIPKNILRTFNIGGNYTFDYKNHIPFIEGGIGIYTFIVWESAIREETKTQFGANLGAGYRYLFDKRFGVFIKCKIHTFLYDSKNWSFWNLSGGVFLKF